MNHLYAHERKNIDHHVYWKHLSVKYMSEFLADFPWTKHSVTYALYFYYMDGDTQRIEEDPNTQPLDEEEASDDSSYNEEALPEDPILPADAPYILTAFSVNSDDVFVNVDLRQAAIVETATIGLRMVDPAIVTSGGMAFKVHPMQGDDDTTIFTARDILDDLYLITINLSEAKFNALVELMKCEPVDMDKLNQFEDKLKDPLEATVLARLTL